jgi:hypothetical protein
VNLKSIVSNDLMPENVTKILAKRGQELSMLSGPFLKLGNVGRLVITKKICRFLAPSVVQTQQGENTSPVVELFEPHKTMSHQWNF